MMREKKPIALVIIIFITSIVIFLITLKINMTGNVVLEEKEMPVSLIIGDHAGFDLNTSALVFGMISKGSSANRKILISNDFDFPVKYEFTAEGLVKDLLVYDKIVYLEPYEQKEIRISTITITDEPYGNYTGKMIVKVKRDI